MLWIMRPGLGPERLGLLPQLLSGEAPAAEQLAANYIGGWSPKRDTRFSLDKDTGTLSYPGEPDLLPDAVGIHATANEMLLLYPHDWLVILKPDDTWEISRVD